MKIEFKFDSLLEELKNKSCNSDYGALEKRLKDEVGVFFMHNEMLTLFSLISSDIKTAERLLENKAREMGYFKNEYIDIDNHNKDYFKKALKYDNRFVEDAKKSLLRGAEVLSLYVGGPHFFSKGMTEVMAIVKAEGKDSLKFFKEMYDKIIEKGKNSTFWDEYKDQIYAVRNTLQNYLKTGKFEIALYDKRIINSNIGIKTIEYIYDYYIQDESSARKYNDKIDKARNSYIYGHFKKIFPKLVKSNKLEFLKYISEKNISGAENNKIDRWLSKNYSNLITEAVRTNIKEQMINESLFK